MIEYPKTANLFERDPDSHKLIEDQLREPEFEIISFWHVTEKIDGTNMRVIYYPPDEAGPGVVEIRGRSDRANLPGDLAAKLIDRFSVARLGSVFDEYMAAWPGSAVTIYGEGYGPGIQKGGGNYREDKDFRMFDVVYSRPSPDGPASHSWVSPGYVGVLAERLMVPRAPFIGYMELDVIVEYVKRGWSSQVAHEDCGRDHIPEGIVARTDPYVFNHRGSRVMFKLKGADLA